ncbi:ABC transporter substrate-binding protein [Collinsella sp. An2]|uniref:peptide ABC transporter substrate-binding protein n=1 Tax=Collinsella sp. An2 TaxID=1965585 RepID=UPI000B3775D4|nr:ABC transporter substrate-binding protein [Collinsella sp. An2]OUP08026.1 ABC transporter substrate-binding protein [Collinsella sp. An2]
MADSKINQPVVGRRAFVGGTLAASSLAFLAACSNNNASNAGSSTGGDSAPAAGNTLNYYINNPVCIDPYNAQEDQGIQVVFQLFDTLTEYDFEKGEIVGLAAESFESNDDATQFTFHLKEATFHNGEAVTSQSFKRAWERIVNPSSAVASIYGPSEISYHLSVVKGYQELLDGSATELTGVTCPDDQTLVVDLNNPYADFAYVVSHPALSPVPEAADTDAENYYLAPIGNGPFKMDGKWEDGQEINVVRYDDYYGTTAKLDGVHFSIQRDQETAYREFQAGNLDVCDVPVAQIDAAKSDRGVSEDGYTMSDGQHMLLGSEPSTYYLTCNNTAEPFNNADFRRAISMAINREAICDSIFSGTRTPADGIVPPGIDGYQEGMWPYCKYDQAAAIELLDQLYPADGDGKRGITLQLSYNLDGGHQAIMESVISDLEAVGITCTSDTQEWAAILTEYQDLNYQFGRLGWIADYPIYDNFLYPLFHSDSLGGDNRSGYSNPEVDELINQARATVDTDQRIDLMHQADAIIGEDNPVIPLNFYTHQIAGSDRIAHLYIDPLKKADLSEAELA